jgi:hypothetical protein
MSELDGVKKGIVNTTHDLVNDFATLANLYTAIEDKVEALGGLVLGTRDPIMLEGMRELDTAMLNLPMDTVLPGLFKAVEAIRNRGLQM